MVGNKKELITYLLEVSDEDKFELKKYKEKRNKNQNSMYWEFLYKLALKLKISVEELHFEMLKRYSPRYEILVPRETILRGITYMEEKSVIKKNNKEYKCITVYTPSHELKTDEFALLLDGLLQECEMQGIYTERQVTIDDILEE